MYEQVLLFFLLFVPSVVFSPAASPDSKTGSITMAELNGPWRFQTGDAAGWADPSFDDSSWALLSGNRSYDQQGYAGYSGFSWYRLRLNVPEWTEPLGLYFPFVGNSFEVYANGRLIGHVGGMPPSRRVVVSGRVLLPLPREVVEPGKPLQLAVRVWRWDRMSAYTSGGFGAAPRIGSLAVLSEWQRLERHEAYWYQTDQVMSFFANLLTALAGLALFAMRPREREYLWFGLAQVLWAVQCIVRVLMMNEPFSVMPAQFTIVCATAGAMFFNVQFFVTLMQQRKRVRYWSAVAAITLFIILILPFAVGWMRDSQYVASQTILELVYGACVTAMIYGGARQCIIEAKLLLVPFTLSFLCNVIVPMTGVPVLAGRGWMQSFAMHFGQLFTWPFPTSAPLLAGDLAMFSVVAVLVLRFARSRRDEERLAAELEAARAVQHVLLPDEIPTVPGFQIECVYKPAGDVGGDFFQILPLPDGGALVVIGDVSGKGMPAAMTVSLLVGMVRILARSTRRPAEILTAINQNMMGRTAGGFTTCLILHLTQSGAAIAANAGHVPPYVNGRELPVAGGLPLGVDAAATYSESAFQLAPAERMTLLTDGVVEARRASGELFGFERAAQMSAQPAAKIAAAAQQFGQEDDITVLSLTRKQPEKEVRSLLEPQAWVPA